MLNMTVVPFIIVECGFLSIYEEAEKLVDGAYQDALAEAVCAGILQCLD